MSFVNEIVGKILARRKLSRIKIIFAVVTEPGLYIIKLSAENSCICESAFALGLIFLSDKFVISVGKYRIGTVKGVGNIKIIGIDEIAVTALVIGKSS